MNALVTPVVLCGGSGTRLWPLSRTEEPKQFQRLAGERTLLQDTLARFAGTPFDAPMILANRHHAERVRVDLEAMDLRSPLLVVEPAVRSTGPAIAAAALVATEGGNDPILLVTPSDHAIAEPEHMVAAVADGLGFAREGGILLFGIRPSGPETGFGYIQAGQTRRDADGPVRPVAAFHEKPTLERAEAMLRDPAYTWNSGLFLFRASTILAELERHAPDILAAVTEAVRTACREADSVFLGAAFQSAPERSIDYAVMEHSDRLGVASVSPGWSDLGSFDALWRADVHDDADNRFVGDVQAIGVRGSYVRAPHRPVAVIGLEDVVVVDTEDAVLVASRTRSQEVKAIAARLAERGHASVLRHPTRAGLGYRVRALDDEGRGRVLHVTIEPGRSASIAAMPESTARQVIVLAGTVVIEGADVARRLPVWTMAAAAPSIDLVLANDEDAPAVVMVCDSRASDLAAAPISRAS